MDKLQIILSLIGIFAIVMFFVMRKKQITINNHLTDSIFVSIDKKTINTVFRNIISNAIKFTKKEEIYYTKLWEKRGIKWLN